MRETHFTPVGEDEKIALEWWTPNQGRGSRTAVFLHGFGSERNGDKALHFGNGFSGRGWNFLSLDMRGHGDSSGSMEGLTLTRCLEDVAAALAWLPTGGKPPALIGSSMGGAVAAWFTLLHPGLAGEIVLIAPAFGFPGTLVRHFSKSQMAQWKSQGSLRWVSEWMDVKIGYGLLEDGKIYDMERLMRDYRSRTLIFHGIQDNSVDWRGSRDFADQCPGHQIDLLLLKDGDHRLTEYKSLLFETLFVWLNHTPDP